MVTAPPRTLTPIEQQVAAAWAALRIARADADRSPNADTIKNEEACERMFNRALDRLPRKETTCSPSASS